MSWAEIKKAINSNISKSLDVLITEKCNELQEKLNSVYNTVTVVGNIPAVKSVQRGITPETYGITTYDDNLFKASNNHVLYIDITINAVNISKSIVNVSVIDFPYDYAPILLNSTTIRVYFDSGSSIRGGVTAFTWQVIEFY